MNKNKFSNKKFSAEPPKDARLEEVSDSLDSFLEPRSHQNEMADIKISSDVMVSFLEFILENPQTNSLHAFKGKMPNWLFPYADLKTIWLKLRKLITAWYSTSRGQDTKRFIYMQGTSFEVIYYFKNWFEIIDNLFCGLTLTRPLRRKLRMRWFFDVSKVKESSFFLNRTSLTRLRLFMRIFWKIPI